MKFSYLKPEVQQAPVKDGQSGNRQARPRGYPIFRTLLVALSLASPLTLVCLWWSSRMIHAYGVVTAHVQTLSAPARSRLDALYVEIGDRVKAGDVLYVLSSDEARAELASMAAPSAGDDAAPVLRAAAAELARAEDRHAAAVRRLDEVRRLLALDAATASDERAALAAERDADLQRSLAAAGRDRARQTGDVDAAHVAQLRALAGPSEVRALADGVVQDIACGPGSTIAKDAPVMTVVDSGSLWIDTYVPAGKARALAHATAAVVYPSFGASRSGAFSAVALQEAKVPAQLRDRMPRDPSALRLRIQVDDAAGLTPGSVARVTLH